jgi:hypothetical protein
VRAPTLVVRHHGDKEIHAIWGPVSIRIVDGATTEPPDLDRIHAVVRELLDEWSTIGSLLIVHHGNPIPSLASMRYARALMTGFEDRIVVSVALLGLGFWAEAGRATTSFFARLARGNTFVLASSVESAVERMSLELVGVDREQLHSACIELERRFRVKP